MHWNSVSRFSSYETTVGVFQHYVRNAADEPGLQIPDVILSACVIGIAFVYQFSLSVL